MKNSLQATAIAVFTMLFALPAYAQAGYQQYPPQAYQPVYQAPPGYGQPYAQPVVYQQAMAQPQNMVYQQPQVYYQQPQIARQPINYANPMHSQAYQQPQNASPNSKQNPNPDNDPGNYNTTSSNAMSPYEQQELALKEAKMLQQLEDMKHSRDKSESFRNMNEGASGNVTERGYVSKSSRRGGLGSAVRGFGSALKTGARVAGPAATSIGASVGTFFLIRSMY